MPELLDGGRVAPRTMRHARDVYPTEAQINDVAAIQRELVREQRFDDEMPPLTDAEVEAMQLQHEAEVEVEAMMRENHVDPKWVQARLDAIAWLRREPVILTRQESA